MERAAPAVTGNGSQNCAVVGAGGQNNSLPARTRQSVRDRPQVEAAIDLLCEAFPKAFVRHEARRRPLKVGIHLDIAAALAGAVTDAELGVALRCYTVNRVY
ncbi:MAG: ProQ/FINO family protein, partial [Rhodoplanes sp.]